VGPRAGFRARPVLAPADDRPSGGHRVGWRPRRRRRRQRERDGHAARRLGPDPLRPGGPGPPTARPHPGALGGPSSRSDRRLHEPALDRDRGPLDSGAGRRGAPRGRLRRRRPRTREPPRPRWSSRRKHGSFAAPICSRWNSPTTSRT